MFVAIDLDTLSEHSDLPDLRLPVTKLSSCSRLGLPLQYKNIFKVDLDAYHGSSNPANMWIPIEHTKYSHNRSGGE